MILSSETHPRDAFLHWSLSQDNPYVIGEFVWTAMDYLGESGIGRNYPPGQRAINHADNRQFPYHAADCGDIDLTGFRKPISHYRNIVWDHGEKLYVAVQELSPDGRPWVGTKWSVTPMRESWTWPGQEGKTLQVEIDSRYPRVQLYLNDDLIGEKPTTRGEEFKATFSVPYAPGVLRAVALDGDKEAQRIELTTSGDVAALRLTADRNQLTADGQDLAFITVESVDAQGRFQPNGNQTVTFEVEGAGTLAGVASGDYSTTESYQANQRKLFNGRAQLIIRTTKNTGPITISVSAPDVKGSKVTLETTAKPDRPKTQPRAAQDAASWNFVGSTPTDCLELSGTKGKMSLSVLADEPLHIHTAGGLQSFSIPNPAHVQQPLVQAIVNELRGATEEPCPSSGVSAARTAAVMDHAVNGYYGNRSSDFWNHSTTWPRGSYQ